MATFYELGLDHPVIRAVTDMGFEEATPIQVKAIPVILKGKDIIGQAQTGTGKTAAFGIPMVEKINVNTEAIQGLVVTPTRELAVQVAEELNKIGNYKGVHALPIYGGQDINRQIRSLKNRPQIVVGTPGRLLDHINRKTIRLQKIKLAILDEADEMLNMGFIEDVQSILKSIPAERQTLLFSATMPQAIQNLAKQFMIDPELITVKSKEITVANIEQEYIEVKENQKFDVLCRLLDIQNPDLAIVFGRTKRRVDELTEGLSKRGYSTEGIHGDLTQAKRNTVLRRFKEGTIDILVATDVAARGLDINNVTNVYNFDIPQDPESYVHRIGRTGRAGKAGLAVTLVTPREISQLKTIEQMIKRRISRVPIPTLTDAIEGQQRLALEKLIQTVNENDNAKYKGMAQELLDEIDSVEIIAAALKLLTKEPDMTPVRITEEQPFRKGFKSKPSSKPNSKPNSKGNTNRKKYNSWKKF